MSKKVIYIRNNNNIYDIPNITLFLRFLKEHKLYHIYIKKMDLCFNRNDFFDVLFDLTPITLLCKIALVLQEFKTPTLFNYEIDWLLFLYNTLPNGDDREKCVQNLKEIYNKPCFYQKQRFIQNPSLVTRIEKIIK